MATTTHAVRARNLQAGDVVELLSLLHTVTAVAIYQDGTADMYTEHTDELGTINARTPLAMDQFVHVIVTD